MKGRLITAKMIAGFKEHLILEERSTATIQKYIRDVKAFAEYARLCQAAQRRRNERLNLILQTICGTGIRVSELQFITVEAAKCGEAVVRCKGKTRTVFIVRELRQKLLRYAAEQNIQGGMIFVTRTGKPISRTNIWREMKALCVEADVNSQKVFPHNLRHLFARVFYGIEKDIAKLADILGHSSINTTRIYNLHRHGAPPVYGEYAPDPMKKSHPFGGGYIIYIMLQPFCQHESLSMRYTATDLQNGAKIQAFSIFALKRLSFAVFR